MRPIKLNDIIDNAIQRIKDTHCSNCPYADYNLSCCYQDEPMCTHKSMMLYLYNSKEA